MIFFWSFFMKKTGFVEFSKYCLLSLFLFSTLCSPLYSDEENGKISSEVPEKTHTGHDAENDSEAHPKRFHRHPEPVKNLVESYVARHQRKKHKVNHRKPYHPGKENPYQPKPRNPENCTEEIRRNYQSCKEQQRRKVRLPHTERRKCQKYRKWFRTRCQAAHNVSNLK